MAITNHILYQNTHYLTKNTTRKVFKLPNELPDLTLFGLLGVTACDPSLPAVFDLSLIVPSPPREPGLTSSVEAFRLGRDPVLFTDRVPLWPSPFTETSDKAEKVGEKHLYQHAKQIKYVMNRGNNIFCKEGKKQKPAIPGPEVIKLFFMLNSAKHEIFSANEYENANNSWHFHIY